MVYQKKKKEEYRMKKGQKHIENPSNFKLEGPNS